MKRKVFKTGHSAAVTISGQLLKDVGLKVGDFVTVEAEMSKEQLIIKPVHPNTQLTLNLHTRKRLGSAK